MRNQLTKKIQELIALRRLYVYPVSEAHAFNNQINRKTYTYIRAFFIELICSSDLSFISIGNLNSKQAIESQKEKQYFDGINIQYAYQDFFFL